MENHRALSVRIELYNKPPNDDLREDAVGEYFRTVWAKKVDVSGKEFFAASGFNGKEVKKFRIRYNRVVRTGMRLKYSGKVYKVTGVLEEDIKTRKKWQYLIAERTQNEGEDG